MACSPATDGLPKYAYVNYLKENERKIVPLCYIKQFSPKSCLDFDPKKVYLVMREVFYESGCLEFEETQDLDWVQGTILKLGENMDSLDNEIKEKRIPSVTKKYLKNCSFLESQDDRNPKRQKIQKDKTDEESVKKQRSLKLLKEKLDQMKKKPLMSSGTSLSLLDVSEIEDEESSTSEDIDDEDDDFVSPQEHAMLVQANRTNEKNVHELRKKYDELEVKCRKLEKLNQKLQEQVIDVVKDLASSRCSCLNQKSPSCNNLLNFQESVKVRSSTPKHANCPVSPLATSNHNDSNHESTHLFGVCSSTPKNSNRPVLPMTTSTPNNDNNESIQQFGEHEMDISKALGAPLATSTQKDENHLPTPLLEKKNNDDIHLGSGIYATREKYNQAVKYSHSGPQLIKNLAILIWGKTNLKGRSVTGRPCNRKKNEENYQPKRALTPLKLKVLQECVRKELQLRGTEKEALEKIVKKMNKTLAEKLIDL